VWYGDSYLSKPIYVSVSFEPWAKITAQVAMGG
jgi:hypothetical protein